MKKSITYSVVAGVQKLSDIETIKDFDERTVLDKLVEEYLDKEQRIKELNHRLDVIKAVLREHNHDREEDKRAEKIQFLMHGYYIDRDSDTRINDPKKIKELCAKIGIDPDTLKKDSHRTGSVNVF